MVEPQAPWISHDGPLKPAGGQTCSMQLDGPARSLTCVRWSVLRWPAHEPAVWCEADLLPECTSPRVAVVDVEAQGPALPELAYGALEEPTPQPSTPMPAGDEELPDKDVAIIKVVAPEDIGHNLTAATRGRSLVTALLEPAPHPFDVSRGRPDRRCPLILGELCVQAAK